IHGGIVNINNSVFKNFNNSNIINNNGKLNIFNSNFTNIHSNGVIYNNGVLNIVDSLFNDINSNDESVIFNNGFLVVSGSVFENISSNGDGGVIYSTNTLNIVSSNFTNNKAVNGGGVIYSIGFVTIDSSLFVGNYAENEGGGTVYLGQSWINISYSQFKNNSATKGGVIYSESILNILASKFENNSATNGGAIYSTNSLNIKGGGITNNNADYGSGIYNSGILNLSSIYVSGNEAEISGIEVFSDDSSYSGSSLIVEASLYSGDNLLNFVFSESPDVYIDRNKQTLSDLSINTVITLKFEDNVYSAKTGNDGVANFIISMPLVLKSTFVTISVIFLHRGIEFSDSNEIEIIGSDEEGEFDDFDDFIFDDEFLVESKSNKGSISSPNSQSSSISSSKSSTAKLTSAEIKKYTKGFTKTKSYKEGYVASGSGMKWTKVDWNKSIHNYPAGLRKVSFSVYHKKVKYSYSKYKKTTKDKKGNTVYYKSYLTGKKKKSQKYLIVKETWKKKTKKVNKYDNPYLKKSTNCEVKNKTIKDKAKEITKKYKTRYYKANAIWNWVRKNIKYNENHHYSAFKTLTKKSGSCQGHSNLIVAMCRALGIPAKYESKFRYNTKTNKHEAHVWALVYVNNKWYVADGTIKKYFEYPLGTLNTAWTDSKNPDYKYMQYYGHDFQYDYKYTSWSSICNRLTGKSHRDTNITHVK
uniref:transglutaminase-like domain-containing protein n=1 Tax=Methanobrevibacter arboriphilus TaxID=39441 RepID=UPI000B2A072C